MNKCHLYLIMILIFKNLNYCYNPTTSTYFVQPIFCLIAILTFLLGKTVNIQNIFKTIWCFLFGFFILKFMSNLIFEPHFKVFNKENEFLCFTNWIEINNIFLKFQFNYLILILYIYIAIISEYLNPFSPNSYYNKLLSFLFEYQLVFLFVLVFSSPILMIGLLLLQLFLILKSKVVWALDKALHCFTAFGFTCLSIIWKIFLKENYKSTWVIYPNIYLNLSVNSICFIIILIILLGLFFYNIFFNKTLLKIGHIIPFKLQIFGLLILITFLFDSIERIFYNQSNTSQIEFGKIIFGHSFTIVCFGFLYGICCNTKFKSFTNNYQL